MHSFSLQRTHTVGTYDRVTHKQFRKIKMKETEKQNYKNNNFTIRMNTNIVKFLQKLKPEAC